MAGSDKRKQSLYFPEEMLKEIQEVGSAKEPGPRDLQHLQSAVQALKTLLG